MNKNELTGVLFTCPMDPDIVSDKPGTCPKCGMDLIPLGDKDQNHSHNKNMEEDFKKRFLLALPLTLIVLVLSPKIQQWFQYSIPQFPFDINWILFALTSIIVL